MENKYYLIGFYVAAVLVGYSLKRLIEKIKRNRKTKPPGRFKVACRAFWSIMKERPHAFCDEECRSVLGDHKEVSYYQANIADLYRQSVETQVWMNKVDKILKGEL